FLQMLANRTCFRDKDAVLALVEDANKNFFLLSVFSSKTKFWLGLEYDGSQWTWPGGYSAGYTNFIQIGVQVNQITARVIVPTCNNILDSYRDGSVTTATTTIITFARRSHAILPTTVLL
ncbi:hypothetical protein V3C99_000824, partial [Haemonchus contortus]